MPAQSKFVRRRLRRQLIVPLIVTLLCGRVLAGTPVQDKASTNFYRFAQEFLRALYPELSGKRYVVSIESAVWYDDLTSPAFVFRLSVGEGPKFLIKDCCFGGYISHDVIGLPQPPPPEGIAPSSPAPAVPKKPLPSTPGVDAQGAIHFKQYLSTSFTFDKQSRLKDFNAEGPAVNDGQADKRIFEMVTAHPEWTDEQVIAAIKMTLMKLMLTYAGFCLARRSQLLEAQCPCGNFGLAAYRNHREHAVALERRVNSASPSLGIVSEGR